MQARLQRYNLFSRVLTFCQLFSPVLTCWRPKVGSFDFCRSSLGSGVTFHDRAWPNKIVFTHKGQYLHTYTCKHIYMYIYMYTYVYFTETDLYAWFTKVIKNHWTFCWNHPFMFKGFHVQGSASLRRTFVCGIHRIGMYLSKSC